MKHEITIVGGGLTGLSLAIALRMRGVSINLHEAGSYPRHRVCGEFISGVSTHTLENLGILEDLLDTNKHTSVSWFLGDQHLRDTTLPTPALGISRYLLDDRLYHKALSIGCKITTRSRQQMAPASDGCVWTAGRKPAQGEWIGLKAHLRGINPRSELEMHSGKQGYLGITQVEDGWYNVCGLFRLDRKCSARKQDLLPTYLEKNGNITLAQKIRTAQWRERSFTGVAGFSLGLQAPTPGVLAIGDSHAIIPPFTGNGMSMALQSSEIAIPHLLAYAVGDCSWLEASQSIQIGLKQRFRKRMFAAKFLHPLLFQNAFKPLLRYAPISPIFLLIR